jgi:hypothetical protein
VIKEAGFGSKRVSIGENRGHRCIFKTNVLTRVGMVMSDEILGHVTQIQVGEGKKPLVSFRSPLSLVFKLHRKTLL